MQQQVCIPLSVKVIRAKKMQWCVDGLEEMNEIKKKK